MKRIEVPTDDEIVKLAHDANQFDTQAYRVGFVSGIAYANGQLEAEAQQNEPWQPTLGHKCAFWFDDGTLCDYYPFDNAIYMTYGNCAALESLDEIGREPSYFINRGRCTVRKDKT